MNRAERARLMIADQDQRNDGKAEKRAEKRDLEGGVSSAQMFYDDVMGREDGEGGEAEKRARAIGGDCRLAHRGWSTGSFG